jgi:hypothetical protein
MSPAAKNPTVPLEARKSKGAKRIRDQVEVVADSTLPVGEWQVDGEVQPGRFSEALLLELHESEDSDVDLKEAKRITVPFGQEFREAELILGKAPKIVKGKN